MVQFGAFFLFQWYCKVDNFLCILVQKCQLVLEAVDSEYIMRGMKEHFVATDLLLCVCIMPSEHSAFGVHCSLTVKMGLARTVMFKLF